MTVPLPTAMSYTTDCAILGNNTIFQVNIDGGQSVLDLKDAIEVEGKKILGSCSAANLNLYHVDIDVSEEETLKNVMEIISRGSIDGINNKELNHPFRELRKVFQQGPPARKGIYIIAKGA